MHVWSAEINTTKSVPALFHQSFGDCCFLKINDTCCPCWKRRASSRSSNHIYLGQENLRCFCLTRWLANQGWLCWGLGHPKSATIIIEPCSTLICWCLLEKRFVTWYMWCTFQRWRAAFSICYQHLHINSINHTVTTSLLSHKRKKILCCGPHNVIMVIKKNWKNICDNLLQLQHIGLW